MRSASWTRSLTDRSIVLLIVLAGAGDCFGQALASEPDQIYLLQQSTVDAQSGSHRYAFAPIGTIAGARKVAVPEAGGHILVLTAEGRVWAWGDNRNAQLGNGSASPQEGWAAVESLDNVSAIAAGTLHSVALKSDGTVWTWGANHQGQLGDGTLTNRATPAAALRLSDVSMIAAGSFFTVALRSDGTVWAFGSNWNEIVPGEAGRIVSEPAQVRALPGIEAIAVHQDRGYARDSQGRFGYGVGPRNVKPLQLREN